MRLDELPTDRSAITITEFAELVGIGRTSAYEAARRGEIPARKIGHRFVVPVPLLLVWLGEADGVMAAHSGPSTSNVTPLRQAVQGHLPEEDHR